jgi:AcrR family transcriptional regulator
MQATRMVKRDLGIRRTQAERSEATRAALIDAARRLFSTKGYQRAGREEIVALAGVTRGALQHHFGDKQGLFLAVYEATEQEVVASISTAAMAVGEDRVEQLRAGCQAYLDAVLDPAVQRICAIDGPAVLPNEARQEITDRYALGLVRQAVNGAVATGSFEDTPVEPLTRMLLAGVMAAAQYVATSEDPDTARAQAGQTVDLLLNHLKESGSEEPRSRKAGPVHMTGDTPKKH